MQKPSLLTLAIATLGFVLPGCGNNNNNTVPQQSTNARLINTDRGKEIFEQRCIACHGLNGKYRKMNAADLQLSKLDSIGIATTIINGRGHMPMFKGVLSDSDVAQLEAYIMTLRKQ